ncbi:hypothetical protein [Streptomyces sp. VRA16 Mangrove soil]|nr:hypothetical protein [Streptomyces sp. VRA16 Mangrove soil]
MIPALVVARPRHDEAYPSHHRMVSGRHARHEVDTPSGVPQ